jgi:hypothetical protein
MDGAVVISPEEREAKRLRDVKRDETRKAEEDVDEQSEELRSRLTLAGLLHSHITNSRSIAAASHCQTALAALEREINGACELYVSAFETLEKLSAEDDDEPGEAGTEEERAARGARP